MRMRPESMRKYTQYRRKMLLPRRNYDEHRIFSDKICLL